MRTEPPTLMPDEPPRQRSQRRQIVAFIVLALVLAVSLGAGIAYHRGEFTKKVDIYFIADDVTGLAPGTMVRASGMRIGKVSSLQLQDDLSVKVVMTIQGDHLRHLRSDARADMVREQLRPVAIALMPGNSASPLPESNPRVAFRRRGTLTEVADDLRGRIAPILDDVRVLTGVARDRKDDIDGLLRNLREVSAELAGTAKEVRTLAADLRPRVVGLSAQTQGVMAEVNRSVVQLRGVIAKTETGLETTNQSLSALNARLPGMLEKADDTLGQVNLVLRDARAISAAAADNVPGLLRSAPPLVDDSREMMQGLRQSWLLRSLLPAPGPALLPIDSHDGTALRDPARR
jgi:phospholipid/cholesterol/gamma-HCH transport system substrate-binding protein